MSMRIVWLIFWAALLFVMMFVVGGLVSNLGRLGAWLAGSFVR